MAKKQYQTYEDLVAECKRLRLEHEQAEAKFFEFLMIVATEHEDIWKNFGHANFDSFLRSNHLCMDDRYRLFVLGVKKVGIDNALKCGSNFTIQAGRADTSDKKILNAYAEKAKHFIAVNHVQPAEITVRTWMAELGGNSEKPDRNKQKLDELGKLRAENTRLRAENAGLRKMIIRLGGKPPETTVQ